MATVFVNAPSQSIPLLPSANNKKQEKKCYMIVQALQVGALALQNPWGNAVI